MLILTILFFLNSTISMFRVIFVSKIIISSPPLDNLLRFHLAFFHIFLLFLLTDNISLLSDRHVL
jgi:hypothetical protein